MRLDKYLADMNAGTRSELKRDIRKGLVTVGGSVAKDPGKNVDPMTDEVCYRGRKIEYETYVYYMLNKPSGVISATDDKRMKTVIDLLPEERRRDLFPVGRLDKDTEGLLLITNDGATAHALLSPKKHVAKRYRYTLTEPLSNEGAEAICSGLDLGDFTTAPAKLFPDGERAGEIEITEGKFHQVKRMFHAVGTEIASLERVTFGPLSLDPALSRGDWRELTDAEIKALTARTAAKESEVGV